MSLALFSVSPARADEKTALERLVSARQALLDGKDQVALEDGKASLAEIPSPNSAYIVGRAHQNLGHRGEALKAYKLAMALARKAGDSDRWKYQYSDEESARQSAKLEAELGRLVVLVPTGSEVTVGASEVLELSPSSDRSVGEAFEEPGDVTITVKLAAGERLTKTAHLFAGKTETIDVAPALPSQVVDVRPALPTAPAPRPLVWAPSAVAGALSVVALGAAIGLRVAAQKDYDTITKVCPVPSGAARGSVPCGDTGLASVASRGRSEATAGDVLFGLAGAGAAASLALAFVLNRDDAGATNATATKTNATTLRFTGQSFELVRRF